MSARTAGEHAWLGGKEVAALRRAEVTSITNERHEAQESESKERTLLLRWVWAKYRPWFEYMLYLCGYVFVGYPFFYAV